MDRPHPTSHSRPCANASAVLDQLVDYATRGGPHPGEFAELTRLFSTIMAEVQRGELSPGDLAIARRRMGDALSPVALQGSVTRRSVCSATDFETLDRIYLNDLSDRPDLRRWDQYFQSRPASEAIRNRKEYFKELVSTHIANRNGRRLRILVFGCGPAREAAEIAAAATEGISICCEDTDPRAVAHARRICGGLGHVSFPAENIFRGLRGLESYDLVWCPMLLDNITDGTAVALVRRLWELVRPGGELVIGNFSPLNPTRDYMEFIGWTLRYRTTENLIELGRIATKSLAWVLVDSEPLGINLFLHLDRPMGDPQMAPPFQPITT